MVSPKGFIKKSFRSESHARQYYLCLAEMHKNAEYMDVQMVECEFQERRRL